MAEQDAAATPPPAATPDPADGQTDTGKDIIVTGVIARGEKDVLSGTSVLSDKELTRDLKPTIGDTPGSFASAAWKISGCGFDFSASSLEVSSRIKSAIPAFSL